MQVITKKKFNLFDYLTLRIQAFADECIVVYSKKELIEAVRYAIYRKIPYYILGGGSNIAIKQSNFEGLVIINRYIHYDIVAETDGEVILTISSGYPMSLLVDESIENGWEGFEYHKGLPGTIGGGIYMNSKWMHPERYVGDNMDKAVLIDKKGNIKKVNKKYFKFSYGYSYLQQTKEIILDIIFRMKKNSKSILQKRAKQSLAYRKQTQPFGMSTCGCFFKNLSEAEKKIAKVETKSAGYLIDKAGLKGFSIGSFEVSKKHANFIVNTKPITSNPNDLIQLVSLIKQTIKSKYGVELQEEVEYVS